MNPITNKDSSTTREPDILLDGVKIEDFPLLQDKEEYMKYLMAEYEHLQEAFQKAFQELKE